jgi:hypothetical protein
MRSGIGAERRDYMSDSYCTRMDHMEKASIRSETVRWRAPKVPFSRTTLPKRETSPTAHLACNS